MSGKGEYFLVRNIRSLPGAEVLFCVEWEFGQSVPSPPPQHFPPTVPQPPSPPALPPHRPPPMAVFDSCWEEGFENEQARRHAEWQGGYRVEWQAGYF